MLFLELGCIPLREIIREPSQVKNVLLLSNLWCSYFFSAVLLGTHRPNIPLILSHEPPYSKIFSYVHPPEGILTVWKQAWNHFLLGYTNEYITKHWKCRSFSRIDWIPVKNERICPFLGAFLIYPKYLYREVPRCFGIFGQIWSRLSNDTSNYIRLIISIGMLKMCTF